MTVSRHPSLYANIAAFVIHRDGGGRHQRCAEPVGRTAPRRPNAFVNNAPPPLTRAAKRGQRRWRTG